MRKISLSKNAKIIIVAVVFISLVGLGAFSNSVFSSWEASAGIYGTEIDGRMTTGTFNVDIDDPVAGYPNVYSTISTIVHCDAGGVQTPNSQASDVRSVTIGDTEYVFALHYYRFTLKVRTIADAQLTPLSTETNRPNPNPVDPRIGTGKAVSPEVWAIVSFSPWDAILGAEERWVGVMTTQVLDTRAGVESGQSEADAGTNADPVLNAGATLAMYTTVDGSTIPQGNWQGVSPDSNIKSSFAIKVNPTLEAGYHDVYGGFFGLQLLDVQAIDVFVAYDILVEVLIMGETPNTGGAVDWDDNSGKNQTAPPTIFDFWNDVFGYWGARLDALGNWAGIFAPILIPAVAITVLVIVIVIYRPRRTKA